MTSSDLLLVRLQVMGYLAIHSPAVPYCGFSLVLCFQRKGGFFVDLFVRVSNRVAVNMYKQLGCRVYRTVLECYSASSGEPDEDAYGKWLLCLKLNGKVLVLRVPGPVQVQIVVDEWDSAFCFR